MRYNVVLVGQELGGILNKKNIIPDMITFGKGIASGFPLAGIIGKSCIMNCGKSYLGGTYGGNAICSAAANATIAIIKVQEK